ncbi:hypothetical protein RCN03_18885 [Escherichia marmotae]|uniref:hypothetical protein n=1 Tax=Escherichia marmotae TaxID=1499973 RepID=UPI001650B349|nr:hypothetical protein [Escherichia coli]MED0547511.1 hypothetical protein [Escherichia marmotae]EFH6905966.1 hypothetical protein [Escherichia coli]EFU2692263.1 hypothetical protein [Escherichia coli]EGM8191010.1 hypothetical protein [Escherichia coli]
MTLPSIITPTAAYVNMRQSENQPVKRQPRFRRGQFSFTDVDPGMRALGHRIARRSRRMQPVHIPALRGSEWAHLLRALEMKRAFN